MTKLSYALLFISLLLLLLAIPSKFYPDRILIWTHLILNSPVRHPIFDLGFVSCIMILVGNVQTLLETVSFPCCKCLCTDTGYLSTTLVCTANFRDCWAHTTCFSPANSEKVLQFVVSTVLTSS